MDVVFDDFFAAYESGSGYDLSQTLSPIPPASNPDRFLAFWRSTNPVDVKNDFKYRLLYDKARPVILDPEEGNGWVEVYCAYWKSVGEIWKAEEAIKIGQKVRTYALLLLVMRGNLHYHHLRAKSRV